MSKIIKLTVDYQYENIVIDNEKPVFNWLYSNDFNSVQTQYQVNVYELSLNKKECVWDSGVIASNETIGIKYDGLDLKPTKVYEVIVETKDEEGNAYSISNKFEMGLMKKEEWHGRYISMPANFSGGTLRIRKKLELPKDKKLVRAKAYIVGLGYHEFYVNGKKMGDSVLNPGFTEFSKRVLYVAYDMEGLNPGDNVIGIELGYGWYGARKVLGEFRFEFEDGTTITDWTQAGGWWVTGSPTINNSIYGGETYDATLEGEFPNNWATLDFEPAWDNGWMFPIFTDDPAGTIELQTIEPIKVCGVYPEVSRTKVKDNMYLLDIGQNIAGWLRIWVKGKRGSSITLKFAEDILDGHANQTNLRSARCTDKYILRGEGIEEFAPRFTYHGFRYVDAIIEGDVEIVKFQGEHVHTSTRQVGSFECSNEVLNKLHKIAVITEENNEHSILTDCPQRDERFGWLNDIGSRLYQTVYNKDMSRFFPKFIHDVTTSQGVNGEITDTAPFHTGGFPADPVCICYLMFAENMYKLYGDTSTILREYEPLKKWVDYLLSRSKDMIMDYYYYADWVPPYPEIYADGIYVSTLYLNWHLRKMAYLAKIAGNSEDEAKYTDLLNKSIKAINDKYFNKESHYYCKNHQSENALAVSLGVCPVEYVKDVVKHINDDISERGYHLTSGNIGYRHVMYVLAEYGYASTVIKVLTNKEYPGWGYMIDQGATTVWERWEKEMGNVMHSFDHPMFGSYDGFLYRYLGGILVNDESNASNSVLINPVFPEEISYVNSSLDTVRGTIVSNWKRTEKGIEVHIEIPYGIKAKFKTNNDIIEIAGVYDATI